MGCDLRAPDPRLPGRFVPALALGRVVVLLPARDPVAVGKGLRGGSHQLSAERTQEAVPVHAVDELAMAEPVAPAGARQEVGRVGHRLGAAGQDDVCVPQRDRLPGLQDADQARGARLVDRVRRHGVGDSRAVADLTGHVGTRTGLPAASHDREVDIGGVDPGALECGPCGMGAEIGRGHVDERAPELADRRAYGGAEIGRTIVAGAHRAAI